MSSNPITTFNITLIIKYSLLLAIVLNTAGAKKVVYAQGTPRNIASDSTPSWIRHLYEGKGDFLNNATPSVTFFKRLSDSTSYCLYEVDDGVCRQTFLATQKNKKKNEILKIGNECDEDFSFPRYSVTTYKHNTANNTFELTTETEKAKKKYLIKDENGETRFKAVRHGKCRNETYFS